MRVTSDLWVSALVRRVFAGGDFAAIEKRGSTEAGAIFIVVRSRFGETDLYGPAPQASYEGSRPDERLFTQLMRDDGIAGDEAGGRISARLEKELRFDPDAWIVEIEAEPGRVAELIEITKPDG
ncbi:DUF1491 family protein [Aquamicrobium sp. LC103]|uniref:DUF1491 family protein n=1 Tax=Aquamicrobium sp. LC103 TaxID=1120658 RepID=UPI00063EB4ED|nr:DUF1491 family protein [Aquamicrobium sp. LC103]TKT81216.1 DUF1491 family protein [Aquamicrobium sp. LC103]